MEACFMKTDARETVYKLSIEDLQHVAREVLERELTSDEIATVGDAVGDYIDWFQAIENAIHHCVRGNAVPS
jgi:beta-xylosidase